MTMDPDDPQVIAYRLTQLEGKVDAQTEKLDALSAMLQKSLCSAPGTCISLNDSIKRLEGVVGLHENEIQSVRLTMAKASASIRTVVLLAGGAGSVIGLAISTALKIWG
jgi:hypothetical protein